jgi:DNA replication protein DnaC
MRTANAAGDVQDPIEAMAEKLYLTRTAQGYRELLETAAKENLSHRQFLERLFGDELAGRRERLIARLIREARFPFIKTIDAFDWSHPTTIPQSMILHALSLDFIEKQGHLIFLGRGGLGKTHLAIAIGYAACQKEIRTFYTTAADMINRLVAAKSDQSLERALRRYCLPRLLIIDELGYLPLDKDGRDLFFQVISKRSQTGSVILTTNKAFRDWGEVFQDNAVATAIAERLIENGELIKIEGTSYRVKRRKLKDSDVPGSGE